MDSTYNWLLLETFDTLLYVYSMVIYSTELNLVSWCCPFTHLALTFRRSWGPWPMCFRLQAWEFLTLICEIYLLSRCRSHHTLSAWYVLWQLWVAKIPCGKISFKPFTNYQLAEQVARAVLSCFNIVWRGADVFWELSRQVHESGGLL